MYDPQSSVSSQTPEPIHASPEASHAFSNKRTLSANRINADLALSAERFHNSGSVSSLSIKAMSFGRAMRSEVRTDIQDHLRREKSELAAQCGLRRAPSPRRSLGRPGRPKRAISVLLARELEPFLVDETLPLKDIAELFHLSIGAVHAYMKWLGVVRGQGRKHTQ